VERHALLCGYSVERIVHDYGVDLLLYTYNEEGEIENDSVRIQLKATDDLPVLKDGRIMFTVERADLEYWLEELLPVILIVYDARNDVAYWVYVQAYFQSLANFELSLVGKTTTIYLNRASVVHTEAIRMFARYKASVLRQRPEVIRYDE
jgi:hypothetical protein